MSSLSTGTTTGTAVVLTADTTGDCVIKTGASATTALTISGNTQSVTLTGTLVSPTISAPTISGSTTFPGATSGSVTLAIPAAAGSTTLTLPSTSGTVLQSGTAVTEAQGGTGTTTGYYGFKNRIINGGMSTWQRGTTFSSINNQITYGSDRFFAFTSGATAQAQIIRSTSVPTGFLYSQQFGRASGNTVVNQQFLCQCIESSNMLDLVGQTVTVSFWAKAGANYSGGNLTIKLSTGTTADQSSGTFSGGPCTGYTGNQAAINTTQAITSTFTKYTFTSSAIQAGALSMGLGIGYTPTGTAGADDNIYITGCQLEVGSTATSFDYRPYGTEEALCQRYFINFSDTYGGMIMVSGTVTVLRYILPLPVTMRAGPTVTFSNVDSGFTASSLGGSGNDKRINVETSASARADFRPRIDVKAEVEL